MGKATNKAPYDVVVAGGGMVGASLAVALSSLPLRLAVVEPVARDDEAQPSFDDRTTALSRSSQRVFQALGLWPAVHAEATPIRRIHVSDRGRFGFAHIDAEEQGVDALGHVVVNRVLGRVLADALARADNVDLYAGARAVALRVSPDTAALTLDDDRLLECRLLAAADGAQSAVREMAGIGVSRKPYGQTAIIGNLLTEKPLRHLAYERFTDRGPLALLPMAGERAGFVWTVGEDAAAGLLQLDDDAFLARLQQAFGYRQGALSRIGKRDAYPLILSRAQRLTARRTVLVGNAAHSLHPAAAQGFNLGLRDVAALCDCIADAADDVGADAILERYASWRRRDQRKLVRFTDGLVRLFGSKVPGVRWLRDAGMLGFDLVPGVRDQFARHTMGLAGRLPRLSRGVPLP